MESRKLGFWDYFALLVKWRKLIALNFMVICTIAVILSFVLPKWYKAETTLLPPTEQQGATLGLASMLSELPIGEFGLPGVTSPVVVFKAILESRTVARGIIKQHNLKEIYRKENLEFTIQTLWDHSNIEITEEGIICISVEERNAERAAAVANSYVEELDRVNQLSSTSRGKSTRIFIEGRLREAKKSLRKAEEELRLFQEENEAISLPDQVTAVIQSIADLAVQKVALEVEKGALLNILSPTHAQISRLQSQIDEFQKQIDELTSGRIGESSTTGDQRPGSFGIPLTEVPSVGLRLARLTREVKIQEAVFELLTQQYEQAKIQEAKDTPTVQVLDRATPPERRSRPVRRRIVLFAAGLSVFASLVFIGWVEYIHGLKEQRQEEYSRLNTSFKELKKDISLMIDKIGLRGRRRS